MGREGPGHLPVRMALQPAPKAVVFLLFFLFFSPAFSHTCSQFRGLQNSTIKTRGRENSLGTRRNSGQRDFSQLPRPMAELCIGESRGKRGAVCWHDFLFWLRNWKLASQHQHGFELKHLHLQAPSWGEIKLFTTLCKLISILVYTCLHMAVDW